MVERMGQARQNSVLVGRIGGKPAIAPHRTGGSETSAGLDDPQTRSVMAQTDWTKPEVLDVMDVHNGPLEGMWHFDRCRYCCEPPSPSPPWMPPPPAVSPPA